MSVPQTLLLAAAIWVVVVAFGHLVVVRLLARGPGGDPVIGFLWLVTRVYCRLWHRVRFGGRDRLPARDADHQGLVVVSNHTGALDPLLVQAGTGFFIKWMMAEEMMMSSLDWLWQLGPAISVARNGRDSGPLREAIRHVRRGGAVGIFPEGRITTPPREIRPFLPGVGLLVSKARAPVLVVWISGTPDTNKLGEAMSTRSYARVEFLEVIYFANEPDPGVIADTLRTRIAEASGWPLNDEVLPPGGDNAAETV